MTLDDAIKLFEERAKHDGPTSVENAEVLRFLRELNDLRSKMNIRPDTRERTCYICGRPAIFSSGGGHFFCQEHRS